MADKKQPQAPHALDDLVARVGKSNPKMLEALLSGITNDELVADGASIATVRIVTDGVRLYNEALDFFENATPAHKANLRGVSPAFLAVAVHHLDALRKLEAETAEAHQGHATARVANDQGVIDAVAKAVGRRDQAYDAMRDAGQTEKARKQVDEAYGVASPPEKLAAGLVSMGKLLDTWLTDRDAALTARLSLANLDKAYAAELEAAALDVRKAVAAAAQRNSPKAAQAALDREDGVQIRLLGQTIRAFENGHALDATIPRLVPISTRRLFNRNTKRAPEAPAPQEPPKG